METPSTEIQTISTTKEAPDAIKKETTIADALLSSSTGGESPKVSLTGEEKEPPAMTTDLLRNATAGQVPKVPLTAEEATCTLAPVVLVQAVTAPTVEIPTLVASISPGISRPATSVHHLTELSTVPEDISPAGYYQESIYKTPAKGGSKKSYDAGYKLKAIAYYKEGHSKLQTAKQFNVHPRRIREWISMEEVLKVSPNDRKRLTKRLLTKMKLSDSMISAMKQLKSGGPTIEMGPSELQAGAGEDHPPPPPAAWVYQGQDGQQGALEQLANLTHAQNMQLSVMPNGSVITETIPSSGGVSDTEPQVQVAEVNITTEPSASLAASKAANIDYLKRLNQQQVQDLLEAMNLGKYKKAFSSEHVDGEILSSLGEEELVELGVNSGVHRIRFLKLVQGRHSAEDIVKSRSA